jgi:glycosyltransferase involved in cell wall biosynthesis
VSDFRPCILIPTYDNPATIAAVVERVRQHLPDVLVVDDGSGTPARERIDELARAGLCRVERRSMNGGKGAAVKSGLLAAQALGYSHALQVDADGQHDLDDIPRFLAAASEAPANLVLGQPLFDASIPAARRHGRRISVFWVAVETFGRKVGDPLCGYRVYPIAAALRANARGDRMDFDPEIAVRMVWQGVPVTHIATRVRYIARADGGVSHFQGVRDNLRISALHTRLVFEAIGRALLGAGLRLLPAGAAQSAAVDSRTRDKGRGA